MCYTKCWQVSRLDLKHSSIIVIGHAIDHAINNNMKKYDLLTYASVPKPHFNVKIREDKNLFAAKPTFSAGCTFGCDCYQQDVF